MEGMAHTSCIGSASLRVELLCSQPAPCRYSPLMYTPSCNTARPLCSSLRHCVGVCVCVHMCVYMRVHVCVCVCLYWGGGGGDVWQCILCVCCQFRTRVWNIHAKGSLEKGRSKTPRLLLLLLACTVCWQRQEPQPQKGWWGGGGGVRKLGQGFFKMWSTWAWSFVKTSRF